MEGGRLKVCYSIELVKKVCEATALKRYIIIRRVFIFAFLLFTTPLVHTGNNEKQLSGDCQLLFHVGSTWHTTTFL